MQIQALKYLDNALKVAVNVGEKWSTVTCIALKTYEDALRECSPVLGRGKNCIQIMCFPTSKLKSVIGILKKNKNQNIVKVFVSEDVLKKNLYLKFEELNLISVKPDRNIIVKLYNFFIVNLRDEAYVINDESIPKFKFLSPLHKFYPHIFVSISNKATFIKVDSANSSEFLYESELNITLLSEEANTKSWSDIITLANSFLESKGTKHNSTLNNSYNDENTKGKEAYAIIKRLCDVISKLSISFAELQKITQIIFEDLVSGDILIKKLITKSVEIHSNAGIKAIFLRHENFLHGLEPFVFDSSSEVLQKSWVENYSESTGYPAQECVFHGLNTFQISLDQLSSIVTSCPLLSNPSGYYPDTQNLSEDSNSREYWIQCVSEGIPKGIDFLTAGAPKEALQNVIKYKELISHRLIYLKTHHQGYGNLSIRLIQDTIENMKRETGLINIYEKRKQIENEIALQGLEEKLKHLDSLNGAELHLELIKCMLAGNMFDWGAKEVVKLMSAGAFDFNKALEKLPERPWLIDDVEKWTNRLNERTYTSVLIYVDNSGYDLVIGELPFARELLKRGAKVVMCVNKEPVLNDVTSYELKVLFENFKKICPILKKAIVDKKLTYMEVSKCSCCLDLCFVDSNIASLMREIDLLVLEGMGRAIHTNLLADFTCDTLRVGVVKDFWFSERLGGEKGLGCICKFTIGSMKYS